MQKPTVPNNIQEMRSFPRQKARPQRKETSFGLMFFIAVFSLFLAYNLIFCNLEPVSVSPNDIYYTLEQQQDDTHEKDRLSSQERILDTIMPSQTPVPVRQIIEQNNELTRSTVNTLSRPLISLGVVQHHRMTFHHLGETFAGQSTSLLSLRIPLYLYLDFLRN